MRIMVSRLHFPVTALGGGRRVGVWMQGCSIGCAGCVSRDTWSIDPTREMPVTAILDLLIQWRAESQKEIDFLCYSGMPLARLEREHSQILARLDAVIPEPYVQTLPSDSARFGSRNQSIVCLSDLGRRRHSTVE